MSLPRELLHHQLPFQHSSLLHMLFVSFGRWREERLCHGGHVQEVVFHKWDSVVITLLITTTTTTELLLFGCKILLMKKLKVVKTAATTTISRLQ